MKKVLLALAGAAVAASAFANPEAIYRAVPHDINLPDTTIDPTLVNDPNRGDGKASTWYAPGVITDGETNQRGGRITFAGTARNVTEASIGYIFNVTVPRTTEQVRLRFYAPDVVGTPITGLPDTVGQVLYDSGQVQAQAMDESHRFTIPNVVMPNSVYYTLQPYNVDQVTNLIGARLYGPLVGTANDRLVRKNSSIQPWISAGPYTVNGDMSSALQPPRSMALTVWADGGPAVPFSTMTTASDFANGGTYYTDLLPNGDDIALEGQNRHITKIEIEYVSDITVFDGDEEYSFDLWANDQTIAYGEPSTTPFYTLTPVPVGDGVTTGVQGWIQTLNPAGGVDVPDNFAWSMTVTGVADAPGDAVGPSICHAPTTGNSAIYFWLKDGGGVNGWNGYIFGDCRQTANTVTTGGTTYGNIPSNYKAAFYAESKIEASGTNIVRGSTLAGIWSNISSYSADVRWGVRPGAVLIASQDKVVVQANFYLPAATVTTMDVVVESKGNVANLRQKVDIKNGAAATFTNLETFTGLPNVGADRTVTLPVASPSTMIDTANANKVVVQLSCNNTTGVLVFPWQYQIDACYLNITP